MTIVGTKRGPAIGQPPAIGRTAIRLIGLLRAALVAAALAALPAPAAHAQTTWGLVGGVTRSTFTGSGSNDVSARTTFMFGVAGDLAVSETFSLRPELHFASKGAWVSRLVGDPSVGPRKQFSLPYVQIPLLAQIGTAGGRRSLRPHLFGGVSASALLRCSLGGQDCNDIDEISHRRIDLGVVVGGELEWRGVGVGVRYEAGVRAMEASIRGNELYNGALSFTARYLLGR